MTTQALNRPVDVLKDAVARLPKGKWDAGQQAIAALAELIEAARGATEERYHSGASSKAACDRLVAAIAAIGSQP